MEKKLTDEETSSDPRIGDSALRVLHKFTHEYLIAKSPSNFYDLTDALENRTKTFYIDFVHTSEEGNKVIAEKMFNAIKKELLGNE